MMPRTPTPLNLVRVTPGKNSNGAPPNRPAPAKLLHQPLEWLRAQTDIKTSADIKVPERLLDQVIGQERAVEVARKAASQKRNLLLIGDPGTGKSMIAKAMAEMLPPEQLRDVLSHHNSVDPNSPKIMTTDPGEGRSHVKEMRRIARRKKVVGKAAEWTILCSLLGMAVWAIWELGLDGGILAFGMLVLVAGFLFTVFKQRKDPVMFAVPKILLEHDPKSEHHASYVDATGSQAGALLGDVRHDPFQSGGLETPTHERVELGAIHRAHKGILFIDEINVLRLESQQALLTAMQEGKYAISGQSETSSGAMVRTDPVPCQFILVAAGNLDALQEPDGTRKGMHPALRSRIRGYGYEVYVNALMDDTHDNRLKLCRFVAQEVRRDGRIPHFEADAIAEVLLEAQRRAGVRGKLTLRLRELGGVVRTAGDIARGQGHKSVTAQHVRDAKQLSRSLEQQIADAVLEARRNHELSRPVGALLGVAQGVGCVGTGEVGEPAGLVVPLVTAVTPPMSRSGGAIAFAGGIETSAASQTATVQVLLARMLGGEAAARDVHLQCMVSQDGVDATGAGLAMAVSAVSAIHGVPVRQDVVLIGALSVNGDVLAAPSVTQQIEAAVDRGFKTVIVGESNRNDVLLASDYASRVELLHVRTLAEAFEHTLTGPRKASVIRRVHASLDAEAMRLVVTA